VRAFAPILDTAEVEQIEPGRWLTFEYIGSEDHLHEAVDGTRIRGAHCTSVDAAFVHRTHEGIRELILVEWKYTEHYGPRRAEPAKDAVRRSRYGELLQEPLYQLMRQQLLAHELEKAHAHGADRVRVAHVMPVGNRAYHESLYGEHAAQLGATVKEVWHRLLSRPDRFVPVDSAVFLAPEITSMHYLQRYGGSDSMRRSHESSDDGADVSDG
jgi:hypothetical protein